jgi:YegS/Rv2252/BmrU family lipid kinase
MRKAAFLYNPLSGSRQEQRKHVVRSAADVVRAAGVEVVMEATRGAKEAAGQAREAIADGCDTVFACGGDGTIHDILQGIVGSDAVLAVIPLGTGNTLAHDLHLPLDAVKAARVALTSKPRRFAVGRVQYFAFNGQNETRYFTVAVGIGVDAHMFYRLNVAHKNRLGMAAYYAKATHLWFTDPLECFDAEFTDSTGQQETAAISELLAVRIKNFGGVLREFAPGASLNRNRLRLVLFKTSSRLRYLEFIARGLLGAKWRIPGIEVADAEVVRCFASETRKVRRVFVEADGELLGTVPAEISIIPNAFNLLVPPAWLERNK